MAEKIYAIHNLDCPNCGAKIEAKFNQLPGVHDDLRHHAAAPPG